MRKLVTVVVVLAIFLIFSPLLVGFLVKHDYQQLITFFNSQNNFRVQVVDYQRQWLSSNATLVVEITNPEFRQQLIALGIPKENLPEKINFTVKQYIVHGPVFFQAANLPSHFGLAVIHNSIQFSDPMEPLLKSFGLASTSFKEGDDLITYGGNVHKHMSLDNLSYERPHDHLKIHAKNAQVNIWLFPGNNGLQGNIKLDNFLVEIDKDSVSIPDFLLQVDMFRTDLGLWIGKNDLDMSALTWKERGASIVTASNIRFQGGVKEENGRLFGGRDIEVEKLQIFDQTMGPLKIHASISNLNSQVIANMVSAYHDIMQRGELYRNEIFQRLSSMLPSVFNPNAEINFDRINLVTPNGDLQMAASIRWPDNYVAPDNLQEMFDDGSVKSSIQVSKKLANQVVQLLSQSSYFRQLPPEDINKLEDMQDSITIGMQQNAFMISGMVDGGVLTNDDGVEFLKLQKRGLFDDYNSKIKDLFMTRTISPEVAYMLYMESVMVKNLVDGLDHQIDIYQNELSNQLADQLNLWVKKGYISQTDNDFTVLITRDDGVLKLNGKQLN